MADKFFKSLKFAIGDRFFPLPIVSTSDNGKVLKVVDGNWGADDLVSPPCLKFLGNEDFALRTYNTTKNWDGTLEYSTDKSTWNIWDGTAISSSGKVLYLRGTGNTVITGSSYSKGRFIFTGTDSLKIACKGNIEYLLDYEKVSAGSHPTMEEYCYNFMFYGCTSLTTAPKLPATTLSVKCYRDMFYNCTSLTTAPELPATSLSNYCYEDMFGNCTSLITIPSLPATTLPYCCYQGMFSGCRSIKLSEIQTDEYKTAYRIPISGTGTTASYTLRYMFDLTGGTFTGTPEINTTYYTSNEVV